LHESGVTERIGLFAQVGHRDDKISLLQHIFSWDFTIEILELVAFESAADGKFPGVRRISHWWFLRIPSPEKAKP
jgi:hypothetical protein